MSSRIEDPWKFYNSRTLTVKVNRIERESEKAWADQPPTDYEVSREKRRMAMYPNQYPRFA